MVKSVKIGLVNFLDPLRSGKSHFPFAKFKRESFAPLENWLGREEEKALIIFHYGCKGSRYDQGLIAVEMAQWGAIRKLLNSCLIVLIAPLF